MSLPHDSMAGCIIAATILTSILFVITRILMNGAF
jgi:hypothetical protein